MPVPVPLLDLTAQYATIKEEVNAAMLRVAESQHFILGPEVEALEKEVARYSHCAHGIGVSSGTDALLVAFMAIGIKPGDEVITTPFTFFATAGAIARLGAKPVFVDIDPETFNLKPKALEAAVTAQSKAIIPVHLYGQMVDMDGVMAAAKRHDLKVVEDAAQAIGSEYQGCRAGAIGDLGCLSFFPSKNLGGFGDGGMVVTNDGALAERVRLLRNHGYQPKYYNKVVGGNFRLDAIQAAVLRVKLKRLDSWTEARQRNATRYRALFQEAGLVLAARPAAGLSGKKGVVLPLEAPNRRHIYNQFVIRSDRRDELLQFLKGRQIGTEIYYPIPMHLQECFAGLGLTAGDFPAAEAASAETLALPIYPELKEEQLASVVDAVRGFWSQAK